ncbi:MAG TPA: prolipoprotein diacylglyceryl transferase [Desulfopila sp.]|nr:prolipoprotein diacylglyceryl transferase [Desulfopila sp.]
MTFPAIDPVLFSLGPLQIRWYGLMYVLGFIASYFLVYKQIRDNNDKKLAREFENLNFILILAVIIGGRLGYVLFYNFSYYSGHPLEILATWHGGMSFHGACIALIVAGWAFCRIRDLDFWKTADTYVVTIPIGLGLGRIGNFINAELLGRTTDLPWGIVFPGGGPHPRHPSQLYEALLEGVVLFIILWGLKGKTRPPSINWPHGTMLALFLAVYGVFRFIVEFFRQPDAQVGFVLGPLTMGQLLSSMMVAGGLFLWLLRRGR